MIEKVFPHLEVWVQRTLLKTALGAVYTYESVYDFLLKVDCNRILDQYFMKCVYKRL
jgi:hypothetical protein